MNSPQSLMRVAITRQDLVSLIQQKGNEQGIEVSGWLDHYAFDQARLMLAAPELADVLGRIIKDAQNSRLKNPLGGSVSVELLRQAAEILDRAYNG